MRQLIIDLATLRMLNDYNFPMEQITYTEAHVRFSANLLRDKVMRVAMAQLGQVSESE